MAAVLKEEAKVWGLDLSAGLHHRFCACNLMMQSGLVTRALLTQIGIISGSDVGIGS